MYFKICIVGVYTVKSYEFLNRLSLHAGCKKISPIDL